ncbi:PREDICTED: uncharacterized protein LOC106149711 [Chinchilla lanigera]|uniref:uncharacterized protein LOC106149711 n=1 Tax=Chinchilla lanigera TaxID=34839 RepID=UPI0006987B17|nr:PREDICTED: uncharacterized protein LOC106149711 [Chinchilla lanigera]
MGNSLGCVKEPKESIAISEKAPISPKKRVRLKKKWKGKKIPTLRASHKKEPLDGAGVTEETETPRKLTVSLQQEDRVGGAEHPPSDILLPGDSAQNSQVGDCGMIVQVKERFQGEIQTAHLLLENEASVAGEVWDSLEEGMTVIAHLLDNPAERNCERSVSQLVEFPRTASCSSRAVLLPLQGETAVARGGVQLGFRCSTSPGRDYPSDTRNQDQLSEGWSIGEGTNSFLRAPQTGSQTAQSSVPSSLLGQSAGSRCTDTAQVGQVTPLGPRLPPSQSDLSMTVSVLPSSSGYGSDGLHLHGIQPKCAEPEKSSTSFSEEDGTLSLEVSHTPSWGLEEVGGHAQSQSNHYLDSWPSSLLKWIVVSSENPEALQISPHPPDHTDC